MEELDMTGIDNPQPHFWSGKRVLITGHSGFKGAWLSLWLQRLGANVTGISMPPAKFPNLYAKLGVQQLINGYFQDIREPLALSKLVKTIQPEIVFHLAAQALVRESYADPLTTFGTNVQGTAIVLDALRALTSTRVIVAITTDKVYRNLALPYPYRETDQLGGHDPYSASKAAAEIVVASYRDAFFKEKNVAVATARAGNVIGGGDWSDDRLIPDAIRAWDANQSLVVRKPRAVRPWQHVLEPLAGYIRLAEQLWDHPQHAGAYNLGPHTQEATTVRKVIEFAHSFYGGGQVTWGEGADAVLHEADYLALEIAKARSVLNFQPRWSLAKSIEKTMDWYRLDHQGANIQTLCEADIASYEGSSSSQILQ